MRISITAWRRPTFMSPVSVWGVDPEDLKKQQRYDAVRHAKAGEEAVKLSVVKLCERVGMSPQNYDKSRKVRERKKFDEMLAKRLVEAERAVQPRLGGLKLHRMLREKLESEEVYLGRSSIPIVAANIALMSTWTGWSWRACRPV